MHLPPISVHLSTDETLTDNVGLDIILCCASLYFTKSLYVLLVFGRLLANLFVEVPLPEDGKVIYGLRVKLPHEAVLLCSRPVQHPCRLRETRSQLDSLISILYFHAERQAGLLKVIWSALTRE